MNSPLGKRYGLLRAQRTLVVGALIAAHGASRENDGFTMVDVRFFFYLFSNWLERDLVRATEAMELTQVRRLLGRLIERRCARRVKSGSHRSRFSLTEQGLLELVDALTSELDERSFDEALFSACFAACYGHAILARAPVAHRRTLSRRLDVDGLLKGVEKRSERVIADLEERVRSSERMQSEALRMQRQGATEATIVAALNRRDAYQLQHVRSFGELLLAMPPDLLRFEIAEGLTTRNRMLFSPLLAQAEAQLTVVRSLRASLAAAARPGRSRLGAAANH